MTLPGCGETAGGGKNVVFVLGYGAPAGCSFALGAIPGLLPQKICHWRLMIGSESGGHQVSWTLGADHCLGPEVEEVFALRERASHSRGSNSASRRGRGHRGRSAMEKCGSVP